MKDKGAEVGGGGGEALYVSFSLGLILCPLCVCQWLSVGKCRLRREGICKCVCCASTNTQLETEKRNVALLRKHFFFFFFYNFDTFKMGWNRGIRT